MTAISFAPAPLKSRKQTRSLHGHETGSAAEIAKRIISLEIQSTQTLPKPSNFAMSNLFSTLLETWRVLLTAQEYLNKWFFFKLLFWGKVYCPATAWHFLPADVSVAQSVRRCPCPPKSWKLDAPESSCFKQWGSVNLIPSWWFQPILPK